MIPRHYEGIPTTMTPSEAVLGFAVGLGIFLLFWGFWCALNWWADKHPMKGFAPDYVVLPDGTLLVKFRPMVGPRGGLRRPRPQIMTREGYNERYGAYPPHPTPEPRWMRKF